MILRYYYRFFPDRTFQIKRAYDEEDAKRKFGDRKSIAVFGPCDNWEQARDEARGLKASLTEKGAKNDFH